MLTPVMYTLNSLQKQTKRFRLVYFIAFLFFSCNSGDKNNNDPSENPVPAPANIGYSIVASFPHDTSSFTEGLCFYQGRLFEGTGNYGSSKILELDLNTGRAVRQASLPAAYFGEGITILNDTLYQLTYKEKKAFAYTVKDFKKVKEFSFSTQTGEGWGLTTDGRYLIASDGGNNIYYYEPSSFELVKTIAVLESGNLSYNINELEMINGFIYANQWTLPYILKIDSSTGTVVGKINLADTWNRIRMADPKADVPNGIAHDTVSKKTYITGKNWPQLFEVQFSQ